MQIERLTEITNADVKGQQRCTLICGNKFNENKSFSTAGHNMFRTFDMIQENLV